MRKAHKRQAQSQKRKIDWCGSGGGGNIGVEEVDKSENFNT
jgi:hypothetical protein